MKLVKNKLSSFEWGILDYLKGNALGKRNAISGVELANEFGISIENLRYHLVKIKKHQDVIIGSCRKNGYYIPLEKEYKESLSYSENKALGHLRNACKQNPAFILKAFKTLNELSKTLDKAHNNQFKMQLTGFERELHNLYADKYIKEREDKIER